MQEAPDDDLVGKRVQALLWPYRNTLEEYLRLIMENDSDGFGDSEA